MSKRDFRSNYVLLAMVAVAAVTTSCQRDVIGRKPGQIPIYSSVSRGVTDKTTALSGITFLRKDDANPSLTSMDFSNAPMVSGDRGAGEGVLPVILNPTQYYLTAGGQKTAYFAAYHPTGNSSTTAIATTWAPDGTMDIITAGLWNAGTDSNPTGTEITFNHALTRVEVILQATSPGTAAGAQARWGAITGIQLEGIYSTITYSFANQSLAGGAPTTVSLVKGSSYAPGGANGTIGEPGNKTIQFASMLVPTTSNSIRVNVVSANGGSVPLTVTMSEALVAGKIHTLTISFAAGTDNISIEQTGIAAWDTNGVGGSGSGEELLPPPGPNKPVPLFPSLWEENTDLWWTTGNLIADGAIGARVGAPTDGGLYFQFGSLIGWTGGASGNGTGVPTNGRPTTPVLGIAVKPANYAGATTLGAAGYFSDASVTSGVVTNLVADNPATGIGDACRYYLGGTWRLPTKEEYMALWGTPPATNGPWQPTPPGRTINGLFFPAAGYRYNTGELFYVGNNGMYWNASVQNSTDGNTLWFTPSAVNTGNSYSDRTFGHGVRCVSRQPSLDEYIVVNGLKWATGNLIADGANGAKIGAPTDYGLYFKFGSLIGWNGGASGDGRGTGSPAFGIAVKPKSYAGGTTWGTVGHFDGSDALGDVTNLVVDNPDTGIGDACRYYLGGSWRLPTQTEYTALWGTPAATNGPWRPTPPGRTINGLFFPAVGFRALLGGSLDYVGARAYYWSASVQSRGNGYILDFNGGQVNTKASDSSYCGNGVRCVSQE